jgi:hypothetical protein
MNRPVLNLATAAAVLATTLLIAGVSRGQPAQHAYPTKGQSPAIQAKDQGECSSWATRQTGYDPARPPAVAVAEPAPVTGSGARLRGAAVGAAVGGLTGGDAGDSAVRGAVIGGLAQRVRNRRAADAQNRANAAQSQATHASWLQARGACLTGRGYTVN